MLGRDHFVEALEQRTRIILKEGQPGRHKKNRVLSPIKITRLAGFEPAPAAPEAAALSIRL